MKLVDVKVSKRIMALFTGEPGTGKSNGAASFPRPIILDLDQRKEALLKLYGNDPYIEVESFGPEEYERFAAFLLDLANRPTLYQTIVIDSLTALARMVLHYAAKSRGSAAALKRGIISMADISDYGAETKALSDMMIIARSVPQHFILIAHLVPGTFGDKNFLLTGGKKIAAEIPGYFNEQWNFRATKDQNGNVRYLVNTVPSATTSCKTVLPIPGEIDQTDKRLFDIISQMINKP